MAEKRKSVTENVAVLFGRQLVTWASTFVLLLFLPRYLGPVDYGMVYLGQSLTMIFSIVIDFGGHFWITKEVARNRETVGQIMADALGLRVVMWLVSLVGLNIYAAVAGYDTTTRIVILVMGIGMVWKAGTGVLSSCYQGLELLKYPAYSSIASAAFGSAVGVTALILGIGPIGYSVVGVLSGLVGFGVCAVFVPRMTTRVPRVIWKNALSQLGQGIPYFLNTLLSTISYRVDTVMLSLMAPQAVLGWYGAAHRLFDSSMFVPSILTMAVFPAMARQWGTNKSVSTSFQRSLDFLFLAGVPVCVGVFAFSREIIEVFYGLESYRQAVPLLQIFGCGMILVYVNILLGTTLLASDKQRQLVVISLAAILINVGLNYLLIPLAQKEAGNGSLGSAIATLITELVTMTSMTVLLRDEVLRGSRIVVQLKVLAAGAAMAGAFWLLDGMKVQWVLQAVAGGVVYVGALIALRTITKSDIQSLKVLVPGRFLQKTIGSAETE